MPRRRLTRVASPNSCSELEALRSRRSHFIAVSLALSSASVEDENDDEDEDEAPKCKKRKVAAAADKQDKPKLTVKTRSGACAVWLLVVCSKLLCPPHCAA